MQRYGGVAFNLYNDYSLPVCYTMVGISCGLKFLSYEARQLEYFYHSRIFKNSKDVSDISAI